MSEARKRHIEEMKRIEDAIQKTTSEYLKRDYRKALRRMRKELREYDSYKNEQEGGKVHGKTTQGNRQKTI